MINFVLLILIFILFALW